MSTSRDEVTNAPPEDAAIRTRRCAAGIHHDQPLCGLALSGGGIRSATFCLGLLRALAASGTLKRFDYLSTVSGGGYAGAALGRLYGRGAKAEDVEAGLASDGSLLLWWLRANGRFLIPAGTADVLQAGASQLRGFLATQFEVAIVALMVAAAIVLPHVLIPAFGAQEFWRAWLEPMLTPWWALLPLPVLVAGVAIFAYWCSRDDDERGGVADFVLAAVVLALAVWLIAGLSDATPTTAAERLQYTLLMAAAAVLACVPLGYAVHIIWRRRLGAGARVVFTRLLARSIAAFAIVFVFGFADLATWIAGWLWLYDDELRLAEGAGLAAITVILARAGIPILEKWRPSGRPLPLESLANLGGILLLTLLALMWLTFMQAFVFLATDGPGMRAILDAASGSTLARWSVATGFVVLYALATLKNLPQLNRSSLHEFYRSRLARAYVSVGNHPLPDAPRNDSRFPVSPLDANDRGVTDEVRKVTQLLPDDDVTLDRYRPHEAGGPIHIVNCCINQTRDDRTGSYNADRKGVALGVSVFGAETGTHEPVPCPQLDGMSLATWVAISGAAASSGMGSLTRPGLSALLFLSGLRLGYWWRPTADRSFGKYRALLSELLARFPGLRSAGWYVSDGGHFDNTGVYALLKRKLPIIVLADCGADPRYLFTDLENLVRKARLDYAAHIEFVDLSTLEDPGLRPLFGTPDSIGPEPGTEHLLLARIRYADDSRGALLVIKPRRLPALPLDVVGYADRDPHFPQQATSDQFFDEAQWESYQALGLLLGSSITPDLLAALPRWAHDAPVTNIGSVIPQTTPGTPSRRDRIVTTVGTSLGFGAIASVLIAGWQFWDEHNRMAAERQRAFLDASAGMAEVLAASGSVFSPELKLRLDGLVNLAELSSSGDTIRRRTLETLANSLEPICTAQTGETQSECIRSLQRLRGEDVRVGPIGLALDRYWLDWSTGRAEPEVAAAPAVPAPAPGDLAPTPQREAPDGREPAATDSGVDAEAAAGWTRADCRPASTSGLTLYIHIYDEAERPVADAIARKAIDAGLAVPGIQNVVRTAQLAGRSPPTRWGGATWLYRGDDGRQCATAASDWLATAPGQFRRPESKVVELPAALRAAPGIIELWIPPPPTTAN
jgi:hypothetical protein